MAAELPFEYFAISLGAAGVRGAVALNPAEFLNVLGTLKPVKVKRKPKDNLGVLAGITRSQTVKNGTEWQGEGDLDVNKVPVLAALAINGAVNAVITQGVVDYVDVTTPGSGYTSAPTVVFTGGAGSGAAGTAILSAGTVVGVVVTNPGSGYTSAPTVSFTGGGGTSAAATAVIYKAGTLSKLWRWVRTMTADDLRDMNGFWGDPNLNVWQAPQCMLDEWSIKGDASSDEAISFAVKGMGKYVQSNGIRSVTVLTPGSGYSAGSAGTLTGGGTGAVVTNTIGPVTAVTVTTPGVGYTSAPAVSFTGGAGSGAAAVATISGGAVTGVTITNPGSGYTSAPTVVFTGGGFSTVAVANSTIVATGIASVTITNPGKNYVSPALTFPTGTLATFSISTAPIAPARSYAPMIMPVSTQLWIDALEGYGVTPVTGRVISYEHTIPSGVTYKYVAQGPGAGLSFDHTARKKDGNFPTTKLVLEMTDMTQFNQWDTDTYVRFRIRHNGPLIETVGGVDHYNSLTLEGYAPFDALDWGEFEGSNRTVQLTLEHEYDPIMGSDLVMWSENTRATL